MNFKKISNKKLSWVVAVQKLISAQVTMSANGVFMQTVSNLICFSKYWYLEIIYLADWPQLLLGLDSLVVGVASTRLRHGSRGPISRAQVLMQRNFLLQWVYVSMITLECLWIHPFNFPAKLKFFSRAVQVHSTHIVELYRLTLLKLLV